jgi:hypothetical protein
VQKCPAGDLQLGIAGGYHTDWRAPGNRTAASCISCGEGIMSDALQPLPMANVQEDGSLTVEHMSVARTAAACCESLAGLDALASNAQACGSCVYW